LKVQGHQIPAEDPDAVCAPCHAEIYSRYRSTPMANASGPASAGFLPGEFRHAKSSVDYRISEESGKVWLSYERDDSSRELKGRRQLFYRAR
jgi:hypothetical protein